VTDLIVIVAGAVTAIVIARGVYMLIKRRAETSEPTPTWTRLDILRLVIGTGVVGVISIWALIAYGGWHWILGLVSVFGAWALFIYHLINRGKGTT